MARQYSDETKAEVMAALLTGQSVSSVAREYDIPKGTVSRWKRLAKTGVRAERTQKGAEADAADFGPLVLSYLRENLITLQKQAEVFRDREWLLAQPASEAAVLHGVMMDKAARLLELLSGAPD